MYEHCIGVVENRNFGGKRGLQFKSLFALIFGQSLFSLPSCFQGCLRLYV